MDPKYTDAYLDEDEGRILDSSDYSKSKWTETEYIEASLLVKNNTDDAYITPNDVDVASDIVEDS